MSEGEDSMTQDKDTAEDIVWYEGTLGLGTSLLRNVRACGRRGVAQAGHQL